MTLDEFDYLAIISSLQEGIVVVDREFNICLINKRARNLLEIEEADLGRDYTRSIQMYHGDIVIPVPERPSAKVMQTGISIKTGPSDNYSYTTITGKLLPVTTITTPLYRGDEIIGAVTSFEPLSPVSKAPLKSCLIYYPRLYSRF